MSRAIIGSLSITTQDGTVLTATSDLALAWKWAEHEHGALWDAMSRADRNVSVAEALGALREAHANGGE